MAHEGTAIVMDNSRCDFDRRVKAMATAQERYDKMMPTIQTALISAVGAHERNTRSQAANISCCTKLFTIADTGG